MTGCKESSPNNTDAVLSSFSPHDCLSESVFVAYRSENSKMNETEIEIEHLKQ